jgi:hypothetical protein
MFLVRLQTDAEVKNNRKGGEKGLLDFGRPFRPMERESVSTLCT